MMEDRLDLLPCYAEIARAETRGAAHPEDEFADVCGERLDTGNELLLGEIAVDEVVELLVVARDERVDVVLPVGQQPAERFCNVLALGFLEFRQALELGIDLGLDAGLG